MKRNEGVVDEGEQAEGRRRGGNRKRGGRGNWGWDVKQTNEQTNKCIFSYVFLLRTAMTLFNAYPSPSPS